MAPFKSQQSETSDYATACNIQVTGAANPTGRLLLCVLDVRQHVQRLAGGGRRPDTGNEERFRRDCSSVQNVPAFRSGRRVGKWQEIL